MQKILIVPQNWLGDIVMSQTLLKRVKSENPNAIIDILVSSSFKSLVERMPEINKAIILDCRHKELGFFKRLNLAKKIKGDYDQSIVLSRSIKSALIPYLAKIPIRTGELGESRYILINDLRKFSKEDRRKTAFRYVSMFSKKEENLDEKYYPSLKSNPDNIKILNDLNFKKMDIKKYPITKIINHLPNRSSLFETILVSANDEYVNLFLKGEIKFIEIQKKIIEFVKRNEFIKYKSIYPKNLKEIIDLNEYVRFKIKLKSI